MLTDGEATREDILDFARRAVEAPGLSGNLWFVFVGHGAPAMDGADGVIVGMDARNNPRSLQSRGVSQRELIEIFEAGGQVNTVMVIDACFSGMTADGESLAPGTQPVLPVTQVPERDGLVVMSAARADQVAGDLPGLNRPAFSYLLLGAMSGWAVDERGEVRAGEAIEFVGRQLRAVPGRTQTPQLAGNEAFRLATTKGVRQEEMDLRGVISRGGAPPQARIAMPSEMPRQERESAMDGEISRGARVTMYAGVGLLVAGASFVGHSVYVYNDAFGRLEEGDPTMSRDLAMERESLANRNAYVGAMVLGLGTLVTTAGWLKGRYDQRESSSIAFVPGPQPTVTFTTRF